MTTNAINQQAIRELLEKALQQVVTTQSQVSTIEEYLQEIKSQVNLSLESIDTILKQVETSEQNAEKVRSDVAATLGEMFDHMSRIVNGAREKMIHQQETQNRDTLISNHSQSEMVTEAAPETTGEILEETSESLPEPKPEETVAQEAAVTIDAENLKIAEPEIAEQEGGETAGEASQEIETPTHDAEQQTKQPADPEIEQSIEPQAGQQPVESLNGNEAGQRAAESIDEMMSTIRESNQMLVEPAPQVETEIAQEEMVQPEAAVQTEIELPKTSDVVQEQAEAPSEESPKETHNGPGSVKPLSELLAKARAGGEPVEGPTELTPMIDEDTEAVNELLNNTSGSIVAQ